MHRQSCKVAHDTVQGTTQCALRFLGYCYRHRGRRQLSLALLLDVALFEQFLQWLLEARELAPRTLLQYLNCAINVAKFLTRNEARPNTQYKDIEVIELYRQLRRQVSGLVPARPPAHDQLAAMQKWLPWDAIVRTTHALCDEYQREPRRSGARAQALQQFLMVSFYVYFPPVRAGPIRQLRLGESLLRNADGSWRVDLRKVRPFRPGLWAI